MSASEGRGAAPGVWSLEEWAALERSTRERALKCRTEGARWSVIAREARRVMRAYTTSFFIVSRFLPAVKRAEVEAVYAAVRYPDEVVDTFPLAVNHFNYWTWARPGDYYGIPFGNFAGWFATALAACRLVGPRPLTNPWAVFVGAAVLLFFALSALAHSLIPVALIGLTLSAAAIFLSVRTHRTQQSS